MFTATKGNKTITWDDGKVTGNRARSLRLLARMREGKEVGPIGGPYTYKNHLLDPISSAVLISELFNYRGIEWSGDVPERGKEYDYIS